jgi:hypothetical protein
MQIRAANDRSDPGSGGNTFQISLKTPVESAGTYASSLASGNIARHHSSFTTTMGSRAVKTKWLAPTQKREDDGSNLPVPVVQGDRLGGQEIAAAYSMAEDGGRPVAEEMASKDRIPTEGGSVPLREEARRPETIQIERVKKPLTVMHLVSRVERAMSAQDMAGAQALIQELTELKGKRDDYVLKLTAFWHMKQDDFDAAASLLLEVLERRPNDLEAGLNMAIIELKRGHIAEAKSRLSKLRDTYPAHETVEKVIQQIGG